MDAIDWEVIGFRDIISNINNMDIQPDQLPLSFRTFNATDTKTPIGPSNNEHSKQPSRKKAIKSKGFNVQNEYTLSECKLRYTKEQINFSAHNVQNYNNRKYNIAYVPINPVADYVYTADLIL